MRKSKAEQLSTVYKDRLKTVCGSLDKNTGMSFFITYLRYIRDYAMVKNADVVEQEPAKTSLATLVTAIAEFEAYHNASDKTQKDFHWNSFCDFVKLNMEDWTVLYDSV